MEIDRSEFLSWMQRLMQRIDVLSEQIKGTDRGGGLSIDGEELLDNQDVLQALKISTRSLQRYRTSGRLPYYSITGKLYYKSSDVQEFIRESFKIRDQKRSRKDKEGH